MECGRRDLKGPDLTLDHKIPRSAGGTHDRWNLQIMCKKCNQAKADKMPY